MTLTIIGGLLLVVAALLSLDARNARLDARQAARHAAYDRRQVEKLVAALHGDFQLDHTPDEDEAVDDVPAQPEPIEEEPARPRRYRGRRRRAWRAALAGILLAARAPFDIADGWDGAVEMPRPIQPHPIADQAAAGAIEAEGLDAELAALIDEQGLVTV